jgi:phosphatidylinositol alpha-1,6-mannosyltransferase
VLLLTTDIAANEFGGIPAVNRLLLGAIRGARIPAVAVSLLDAPDLPWIAEWPGSFGASGSRARYGAAVLSRARHARGSVVLITHVALAPFARAVKRLTGAKFFAFLHGVEAWEPLGGRTAWGLAACDRYVTNSEFTLARFREANPAFAATPGAVCYLPARSLGGEDRATRTAAPNGAPNGSPKGSRRAIVVGRLWGRGLLKGQRELITVWPRVLERVPNAELLVVGGGEGRGDLEALAREKGVSGAVSFPGEVSDAELDALYRDADLYAMPSEGEGFGLVFAEAMARGLACIASREDAGSEVVVDGETGLHVAPRDLDEIHTAVVRLLGDDSLRERMGEAGRERAERLFSLAGFNRRMEEILRG